LEAVHYSFVNFEGIELSTRKGQTAPVDRLIADAEAKAEAEIEKEASRQKRPRLLSPSAR